MIKKIKSIKDDSKNITELVSQSGCFDLQFRKDIRHERTGSPTYYRWKIQFIITTSIDNISKLKKVKKNIDCGRIIITKNQARFSVEKIEDLNNSIVSYFQKNKLTGNKKKDFELWQKAVQIIYKNKGKYISKWEKSHLLNLIQIHNSISKYKKKPRKSKWLDMAKTLSKSK